MLLQLLSAMIFPFPRTRARERYLVRGDQTSERSSPELLSPAQECVEPVRPTMTDPQRNRVASAPELRLVVDASDARMNASEPVPDASESRQSPEAAVIAFDRRKEASTGKFVRWLSETYGGQDLSRTRLIGHYFEFCELFDRRPLTERQLLNGLRKHGVQKTRPTAVIVDGKQRRPTTYRCKPSKPEEAAA